MATKRKSSRKRRTTRKKPSLDFSITGLIYCTMMMFIGLAAINVQANLLFGVFGLMIGILLVSFIISGMVISKLKVERLLPEHAVVGRVATIYYQITNRKSFWPSLSVTVGEIDDAEALSRPPNAYLLHCANRMTASIPAEVTAKRRGIFEFNDYQLSTSFPFGFVKRAMTRRHADKLIILPAIGTMRRELMHRFQSAESVGQNVRPSRGGNDEFYGVKEYRAGDNPRWIYWKRSARGGEVVMREMTRVSPPKLLVLVDTLRTDSTIEHYVATERAIAMAATLIDHAMEAGLPIGLVMWSKGWITVMPNHGKRHRLELLTHLAGVDRNQTYGLDSVMETARPLIKSDTTAVVFSPTDVAMSFGQTVRGRVVGISALEKQYQRYFRFDPAIDFSLGYGLQS